MEYKLEEYIIGDRNDADKVLSILKERAHKYGLVSVADYHDLIGVISSFKNSAYGWTNDSVSKAEIVNNRFGYVIKFPPVEDLLIGKEVPVVKEQYIVRLDMVKALTGENEKHTITISESLLNICGVIKVWDRPNTGHRLFYVRSLPQDVPQAGVHWIEE